MMKDSFVKRGLVTDSCEFARRGLRPFGVRKEVARGRVARRSQLSRNSVLVPEWGTAGGAVR